MLGVIVVGAVVSVIGIEMGRLLHRAFHDHGASVQHGIVEKAGEVQ